MRYRYLFSCVCIVLSGCTRYVAWGKKTFYQATTYSSLQDALAPYMRSAYEYDMLQTVIRADILWVNRVVREIHAQAFAERHLYGPEEPAYQRLIEKDVKDLNTGTTMYVFIASSSDKYPPLSAHEEAIWTVHLSLHGNWYKPEVIEVIELDQEYQMLVGSAYNRYRTAYKVVFPVVVTDDERVILTLLSSLYQVSCVWDNPEIIIKDRQEV